MTGVVAAGIHLPWARATASCPRKYIPAITHYYNKSQLTFNNSISQTAADRQMSCRIQFYNKETNG